MVPTTGGRYQPIIFQDIDHIAVELYRRAFEFSSCQQKIPFRNMRIRHIRTFTPPLFFKDSIYLFMRHTHKQRQRHRQRKKQAPCREPDVGLDPRTPGSHPEPKAEAQPLSYPGVPTFTLKMEYRKWYDKSNYRIIWKISVSPFAQIQIPQDTDHVGLFTLAKLNTRLNI